MKIAILSESPADDVAVLALAEGLTGATIEPVGIPWLRTRGWPSIRDVLPKVMQYLYYQTDARGLILVADSDRSPVHGRPAEPGLVCAEKCRMCLFLKAIARANNQLSAVAGRAALKVAIGLAIPSIEAWNCCGLDPQVNEAAWKRALDSGEYPYDSKQLKRTIHGTDRPSLEILLRTATKQSQRLVDGGQLPLLEKLFPIGFGSLATEVRSWLP
jgi:hypothetical protein